MAIIVVKSKKYRICKYPLSTNASRGAAVEALHNWAHLNLEARGIEPTRRHYRIGHNEDAHAVYIEGPEIYWS